MKTTSLAALAVLLLAGTALPAAAVAQERGPRERPQFGQDGGRERPNREFRREAREARGDRRGDFRRSREGAAAATAPQAAQAPLAPGAPEAPRARRVDRDQADLWRSDRQRSERQRGDRRGSVVGRPGGWVDDDGDDLANISPADRADREDRREAREWRRWQNGETRRFDAGPNARPDARREVQAQDRDRARDRARDRDRDRDRNWDRRGRDDDRRDWNGRWDRSDRDRWDRHDRDRDRRRGDRPYWSQGRYPFSYHSTRRYRGPRWVAPPGFYVRSWSHGDYLPWGWYGASYRLDDWWAYGLPWPPPGFDWVRSGPDVLLVDRFSGRIVQVVRMVFW